MSARAWIGNVLPSLVFVGLMALLFAAVTLWKSNNTSGVWIGAGTDGGVVICYGSSDGGVACGTAR